MKLAKLLLVLSFLAVPLHAQVVTGHFNRGPVASIAVVQHKSTFCAGTTCALAFASNNASGNLLVYLCADNSGTAMTAATDNNTNTISNATAQSTGAGVTRIDFVASSHSGANTVTCNANGASSNIHTHIWEISGTTGTLDSGIKNTGSQAATSQSISTTGVTTAANEIVFGFFYDQPNDDSLTAGTGYSPSEFTDTGAGGESALSEVKIVSSTGTQTATATCGSATNTILQTIVTFK